MKKLFLRICYIILKIYGSTLRFRFHNFDNIKKQGGDKLVFAIWHGQLLPFIFEGSKFNMSTVVSLSKDGEIASFFLNLFGIKTARGSSSRGGSNALNTLRKMMNENNLNAAVTIDGPKGPRLKPKPGVVYLAKITGQKIVPLIFSVKKYHRFKSWDGFILPYPFSKIDIIAGEVINVSDDVLKESIDKSLEILESSMLKLTRENFPDFL